MTTINVKNKVFVVNKCPCCNHQPYESLDFFHRVYKEKEKFSLHCLTHEGGCGIYVLGDDEIQTLNIWNNAKERSGSMCCFFCDHQLTESNITKYNICWYDSEEYDMRVYGSKKDFEGKEYKHCFKITCPNCQSTMLQDDIAGIKKYFN